MYLSQLKLHDPLKIQNSEKQLISFAQENRKDVSPGFSIGVKYMYVLFNATREHHANSTGQH